MRSLVLEQAIAYFEKMITEITLELRVLVLWVEVIDKSILHTSWVATDITVVIILSVHSGLFRHLSKTESCNNNIIIVWWIHLFLVWNFIFWYIHLFFIWSRAIAITRRRWWRNHLFSELLAPSIGVITICPVRLWPLVAPSIGVFTMCPLWLSPLLAPSIGVIALCPFWLSPLVAPSIGVISICSIETSSSDSFR